jgi:hypothetical protein
MNRWRTILWLLTHRADYSEEVRVVSFAEPHSRIPWNYNGSEAHLYVPIRRACE